jgi:hypothetical protein
MNDKVDKKLIKLSSLAGKKTGTLSQIKKVLGVFPFVGSPLRKAKGGIIKKKK